MKTGRERSKSKQDKRARTPKAKSAKQVVPIDEKTEEDMEKEMKARREAAEKIRKRQEKYMQEIAAKREKEQAVAEEERRKKDLLKKQAREQVKQIFEKVNNAPGLKELQEKDMKAQESDEEEAGDEEAEKKKKKKKQQ